MGFEPTWGDTPTCFQDRRLKPLGHPSMSNFTTIAFDGSCFCNCLPIPRRNCFAMLIITRQEVFIAPIGGYDFWIALLQGCHCEPSATLRSRQAPAAKQFLCWPGDCFPHASLGTCASLAMTDFEGVCNGVFLDFHLMVSLRFKRGDRCSGLPSWFCPTKFFSELKACTSLFSALLILL